MRLCREDRRGEALVYRRIWDEEQHVDETAIEPRMCGGRDFCSFADDADEQIGGGASDFMPGYIDMHSVGAANGAANDAVAHGTT